jgi:hypothetical protein
LFVADSVQNSSPRSMERYLCVSFNTFPLVRSHAAARSDESSNLPSKVIANSGDRQMGVLPSV